ncbi:MAG TPA: acetyl-CoA carboxylase biotin carboxyl carrier protein [Bacillales bacterium]|nr:acetyl-CoA carboxylase biotin carboxyl carrier protein [Bacillales bacterium]
MKEDEWGLKIEELRELIEMIDQSTINEFEYEQDGEKVTLKKSSGVSLQPVSAPAHEERAIMSAPAGVEAKPAAEPKEKEPEKQEDENLHKIESPMVGTFYTSPSPEAGAYVKVGDKVQSDSVVCIVEAMKLFNEIEADQAGEIVKVLVDDGELVEYGQPLFLVKPE